MAKVILNQTISRPILYNFAQQKIAEAPSECKDKLNAEKKKFMATIKPIKEFAQNKLNNLYPQEDLKILTKYNLSNKESCFWFTDRDKRDSRGRVEKNEKSIYANFCKEGYGGRYSYGSSKKEIGNLSTQSLIALFFDDMVNAGIDVMKYLYVTKNNYDYTGKRISRYNSREFEDLEKSINAYNDKFMDDNGLEMSFTMPNSSYSCYERAQLVTPEEYQILFAWVDNLEGVRVKFHKYQEEMNKKFNVFAEFIAQSKTLEAVVEKFPRFEECRSKITGQSTALSLISTGSMDIINQLSNSLDAQDEKRALKDKVAVVVTPAESKWGGA